MHDSRLKYQKGCHSPIGSLSLFHHYKKPICANSPSTTPSFPFDIPPPPKEQGAAAINSTVKLTDKAKTYEIKTENPNDNTSTLHCKANSKQDKGRKALSKRIKTK